ncbi:MAG: NAD(P)H-hydrate dehydratase [Cyanobacteria bacterium Co-bin13]|nr:NAD(P)H-hydrate dehydratase [Cyanobacteria bacterium Co-bin13]
MTGVAAAGGGERGPRAGPDGSQPASLIHRAVVTADQMRQIEARIFAAGMPVAALMEKVAGLIAERIKARFPQSAFPHIGVLVGPGHNGGDALVVARELHLSGYGVQIYAPFSRLKELTEQHARYAASLDIPFVQDVEVLQDCSALIDGLFGFGLERALEGDLAQTVETINSWPLPKVSIDLPSGLHTDTGAVLGTALRATHTLCLGLWKRAFFQDEALPYLGEVDLIDFGIPAVDVAAVLGQPPKVQRLTPEVAIARLPLPRPPATHKYRVGHLLLIAGSRQYGGAALLAGLGARASGVGMVTLAVPESLRGPFHAQLPEALILGCPETETGAIAHLPDDVDLDKFNAIACGPGLSRQAQTVVEQVLASNAPLLLDADGLNLLAEQGATATLSKRTAPTLLTPHPGEFKRLFPTIAEQSMEAGNAALAAAQASGAVIILKGGRSAIASPQGQLWYLAASTPALARGGSGDVLTGLAAGLLAQSAHDPAQAIEGTLNAALSAAWWHAEAARAAAQERSVLGVDPLTLTQFLDPTLAQWGKH